MRARGNLKLEKKSYLDLSILILVFLFLIFAISNLLFFFKISINAFILPICLVFTFASSFILPVQKKMKLFLIFALLLFFSFVFSNFFFDSSFDGRCYHFATQYLLKLGYNPIFDDIQTFAEKNNIFFNLLFSSSYPNAQELIRSNFYLILNSIEGSKTPNFLFLFCTFSYCFYFFKQKFNSINSFLFCLGIFLSPIVTCQINTKMADFSLYFLFILELFSLLLIEKNIDKKKNSLVFVLSSILAIGTKYIGAFNFVIISITYIIYKLFKKEPLKNYLKGFFVIIFSSAILCFQPYITNIIKFQNPLYPSLGFNKKDFMTKQNPKEFIGKNYLYKFFRSTFSCSSDSRVSNKETLDLYYKIPFTKRYDLPFVQEEFRISGFGHWFSGIFLISLFLSIYLLYKKKGILAFSIIFFTTFLNPLCFWARFVSELYLLPVFCAYYFKKKKYILYMILALLLINGFWVLKENFLANAYKTNVIYNFYQDLYEKSKTKPIKIYIEKSSLDENDSTIIPRLEEFGVDFEIVDDKDNSFKKLKNEHSISNSYYFKE